MIGFIENIFFRDRYIFCEGSIIRKTQDAKSIALDDWIITPVQTWIDHHFGADQYRVCVVPHFFYNATAIRPEHDAIWKMLGLFLYQPKIAVVQCGVFHPDQDLVFQWFWFFILLDFEWKILAFKNDCLHADLFFSIQDETMLESGHSYLWIIFDCRRRCQKDQLCLQARGFVREPDQFFSNSLVLKIFIHCQV